MYCTKACLKAAEGRGGGDSCILMVDVFPKGLSWIQLKCLEPKRACFIL